MWTGSVIVEQSRFFRSDSTVSLPVAAWAFVGMETVANSGRQCPPNAERSCCQNMECSRHRKSPLKRVCWFPVQRQKAGYGEMATLAATLPVPKKLRSKTWKISKLSASRRRMLKARISWQANPCLHRPQERRHVDSGRYTPAFRHED